VVVKCQNGSILRLCETLCANVVVMCHFLNFGGDGAGGWLEEGDEVSSVGSAGDGRLRSGFWGEHADRGRAIRGVVVGTV
jgi:hypothetical protein